MALASAPANQLVKPVMDARTWIACQWKESKKEKRKKKKKEMMPSGLIQSIFFSHLSTNKKKEDQSIWVALFFLIFLSCQKQKNNKSIKEKKV